MRIPPWEDPKRRFPSSLVRTWSASLREPGVFFRAVANGAGLARPLLYFTLITIAAAMFSLWWSAVYATPVPGFAFFERLFSSEESERAGLLLRFFVAPFVGLGALFAWTAILHVSVSLLTRDREPLGTTLRAVSYASGPRVLQILPFIGAPVGAIWMLALTAVGIREAHRMTTGSAVAAILLAVLVPAALVTLFIVVLLGSIVSGVA